MRRQFVTRTRIWNCVRMMSMGKSLEEARAWLMDHEGLAYNTTRPLMREVVKQLRRDWTERELVMLRGRMVDARLAAVRQAQAAGDGERVQVELDRIESMLRLGFAQQQRQAG